MARYCTNCGRELREGEVCGCRGQEAEINIPDTEGQTICERGEAFRQTDDQQEVSSQEEYGDEGYTQRNVRAEENVQESISKEVYADEDYTQKNFRAMENGQSLSQESSFQGEYEDEGCTQSILREEQGNYQRREYQQGQAQGGYQQGNYQRREYQQGGAQGGYQQGNYQRREYQQGQAQGGYQQGNYQRREYQQGGAQGGCQQGNYQRREYQQGRAQGGYQQGNYQRREYQQGGAQNGYQQGNHQRWDFQQGGYQQNGPYQDQRFANGQWFHERKDDLVKHTKNIFAQIPKLLRRPDTAMGAISSQNSSILGLEMFSFQAVVTLVILFILKWRLQSMSMSLFSMPLEHVPVVSSLVSPLNIILVSVFASFGTGYLEAAILTGITIAFKGKTSIHRMVCAVGYKAMIQGLFLALAGILSLVSLKLALYLLVIGFMAAYLFFIDGYRNAVEIDRDRRLYAFLVGQILVTIAMMIILNFVVTSVITSAVGSALGELGNGLGGYGSGGLFQNLY